MKYPIACMLGLSVWILSTSARTAEPAPRFVPPSPLGRTLKGPHSNTENRSAETIDRPSSSTGSVTIDEAIARALLRNEGLAVTAEEVRKAAARIRGAGLYPNPELAVDAEDFLGSGVAKGVSGIQVTAAVSQPVELGGKRRRRKSVAEQAEQIAAWQYEQARVALITDVKKAFYDVLAAQRRTADAEDMVRITEDVLGTFQSQMEAGKITAIEINNAEVALARARIEASLAMRDLAARRRALCVLWADMSCNVFEASGSFEIGGIVPPSETLTPFLEDSPELAAARAAVEQRQAEIALERAHAVPDVTFSVGYRWLNDPGDSAVVAGAAVPLPFANRNQGEVRAAEISLKQAQMKLDATRIRLTGALMERIETLAGAWSAADILQREVLPKAAETLDAIREGNRLGRFGYLDMLRAEETYFQVREETVAATRLYLHALAEVEQLIARPLVMQERPSTTALARKPQSVPTPQEKPEQKDAP